MAWRRASTARLYVPILLATSPLAAMRSAPTMTTSTSPRLIRWPAMLSVISVHGMPSCTHSQGGAMAGRGEGARIAMSHDACPVWNELRAQLAHRAVRSQVLFKDRVGLCFEIFRALHALESPEEIDRRRAAFRQRRMALRRAP